MNKLGIDIKLLIAQVINFAILAAVLTKFLYQPVLRFIAKRQAEIDKGLKGAEMLGKEKLKVETDREAILKKARSEAAEIIRQTKLEGKKLHDEMVKKAESEIARQKESGRTQLAAQKEQMEKIAASHAVTLAKRMVEQILADGLTLKDHDRIINHQIAQLKNR